MRKIEHRKEAGEVKIGNEQRTAEERPVILEELIDEMILQFKNMRSFLHRESKEVVWIHVREFEAAKTDKPLEEFPDWRQDGIWTARHILGNGDDYIPLPEKPLCTREDFFKNFCRKIEDNKLKEKLLSFDRRDLKSLRKLISQDGIRDQWKEYRMERMKNFAIQWCEENSIPWCEVDDIPCIRKKLAFDET